MGELRELKQEELEDINGGFVDLILLCAGYVLIRDMVTDAGRAAAYKDLGYPYK